MLNFKPTVRINYFKSTIIFAFLVLSISTSFAKRSTGCNDFETAHIETNVAVAPLVYVVTNTNNSGVNSLDEAISFSNSNPGIDTIQFDIPGVGPHTISLTSALTDITDGVVIDGFSQSGAILGDLVNGTPHILKIEIVDASSVSNGIRIDTDDVEIKGLCIGGFSNGIEVLVGSDNLLFEGCYIGTNISGTANNGNSTGILLGDTDFSVVRNCLISGNWSDGVTYNADSNNNHLYQNLSGVDVTGTIGMGNGAHNFYFRNNAHDNLVGGNSWDYRNVLSGSKWGFHFWAGANNRGSHNFVGTDISGTLDIGNTEAGVEICDGDYGRLDNNVFGNNYNCGILLWGSTNTGWVVDSNYIGVDTSRTIEIGNGVAGVCVYQNHTCITIKENFIANSVPARGASTNIAGTLTAGAGIWLRDNGSETLISENSIYNNDGLGIDNAVQWDASQFQTTALNDDGDGDSGANDVLNYPVIDSAYLSADQLCINGWVGAGITAEFYISDNDASGFGEGKTFLFSEIEGSVNDIDATTSSYGPGPINGVIQGSYTNENRFEFCIDLNSLPSTISTIDSLTAIASDISIACPGATSEFSAKRVVSIPVFSMVGNRIWLDENADGIQDASESGIPGVVVELQNGSCTTGVDCPTTITDANGGYVFKNISPGNYTVKVLSNVPTGLESIFDEDNGTTAPNMEAAVIVSAGGEYVTADFGYNYTSKTDTDNPGTGVTGAFGNRIWNDANGDGVQNPGESGIENVTVNIYNDLDGNGVYDTFVSSTTTDANGNYIFDGLTPAAYAVEVDATSLTGFNTTPTYEPDGDANNTSKPIIVAPGDVVLIGDFGYMRTTGYTISDLIYIDANDNGNQDAGEPGIPGVTVSLKNAIGSIMASTTTDANGNYSFPGLEDLLTYTVVIYDTDNVLEGLEVINDPNGGNAITTTVTLAGQDDTNQDFGFAPIGHTTLEGMIGNTIFLDTDNNNALTPGEGVEGVLVELFASNGTSFITSKVTNENGEYYFGNLNTSDTYVVKVEESTLPGGDIYFNTVDPNGSSPGSGESTSDLSVATNGVDLTKDFGYAATIPHSISGTVWEDFNADGSFQAGESDVFGGVTIDLLDVNRNVLSTALTTPNGHYNFSNIPDGDYIILVTDIDAVLMDTWHSLGVDSEQDQVAVNVNGSDVEELDFGYYSESAALGNRVWEDADGNGIQNNGETGLENVLVTLTIDYGNGNIISVSTLTDVTGYYSFNQLLLDEDYNGDITGTEPSYTLSAAIPSGFVNTTLDATNDSEDADDPSGVSAFATQGIVDNAIHADPTMELSIATYDFGFMAQALPVELISFQAKVLDCDVQLDWTTGLEENFSHFEIERSSDGDNYKVINMTFGDQIEGRNSTYNYLDKLSNSNNYYRLKIVDLDGTVAYSEALNIRKDCESVYNVKVYPNPINTQNGTLTVEFYSVSEESQIDIYDLLGQRVFSQQYTHDTDWNLIPLDVSQLTSGTYILHFGNSRTAKRFVVQE